MVIRDYFKFLINEAFDSPELRDLHMIPYLQGNLRDKSIVNTDNKNEFILNNLLIQKLPFLKNTNPIIKNGDITYTFRDDGSTTKFTLHTRHRINDEGKIKFAVSVSSIADNGEEIYNNKSRDLYSLNIIIEYLISLSRNSKQMNYKNLNESLHNKLVIAYRCINNNYENNYDGIQYFAVNQKYARSFGNKCYKALLDLNNAKILNLSKWNQIYEDKSGEYENLFEVGDYFFKHQYDVQIDRLYSTCGVELTEQFIKEFNLCDVIYGEDAGYPGEFVYAVKNKKIISKVEPIEKYSN